MLRGILIINVLILQNDKFFHRKEKEDMELETSELKQKLNLKNTEFISLQQEFQEKAALLSLNELKIQQVIPYDYN